MTKTITILIFTLITFSSYSHKYFVSISNLEYNEEEGRIDCSLQLTAHDFEQILETEFGERIHIENVADSSEIGIFITDYLDENFKIWSAGQQCVMEFLGKEVTLRDELFFYISFWGVKEPKGIKVKNSLLCKTFAKQQNIVHYRYKDQTKSVTLLPSATEAEILID